MRNRLIALIALTFVWNSTFAQEDSTQVKSEPAKNEEYEINSLASTASNINYGGYGSLEFKHGHFGPTNGWMLGGNGAFVFQHKFAIGAGGYFNSSLLTFKGNNLVGKEEASLNINYSYAGLFVEYNPKSDKLVHFSFPVWFGWGNVKINEYTDGLESGIVEQSKFFMVEPAANLEINVSSTIRIYGGAALRFNFLNDELTNLSNNDLSSFMLNLGVKFGKF